MIHTPKVVSRKFVIYSLQSVFNSENLTLKKLEFPGWTCNSFDTMEEAIEALVNHNLTYTDYLILPKNLYHRRIMGTNYYGFRKPTKGELIEIAQSVLAGNLEQARIEIKNVTEDIHIGKSSGGWKFLFNKNEREWSSFEEYKTWINQFEIRSEYGEDISYEDFWQKVENKQKDKSSIPYCTDLDGYDFSTSNEFC